MDGLARLVRHLDDEGDLDSRTTFSSGPPVPAPDLAPLRASGIPGSYRMRVGPYRLALALLPDERLVLVTVAVRRDDNTYSTLPDLHRKRFRDR
ncbi:MAG: hypothetical protein KY455_04335 [Euryarchaeota archaeon]|nr:hypothetical protein [Euryarchaeota archaeon]